MRLGVVSGIIKTANPGIANFSSVDVEIAHQRTNQLSISHSIWMLCSNPCRGLSFVASANINVAEAHVVADAS